MKNNIVENDLYFKWYLNVFEDEGKAVFIVDESSNILALTDTAAKLYEGAKEGLVGRNLAEFDYRYRKNIVDKLRQKIFIRDKISFRTTHFTLNKRPINITVKAFRIKETNDRFLVIIDNAEKMFRDKIDRELLGQALDSIGVLILIVNKFGNIEYINKAFTSVTGFSRHDLLGKNPRMFNSEFHESEYYTKLWETVKTGEVFSGHFRNKKKSDGFYWEKFEIYPVFDENNEVSHYLKISHDITEEMIAKEHLEEKESQFQSLFEDNYCVMILLDPYSGIIERVNKAAVEYYGYERYEIEGAHIEKINMLPKELLNFKMREVIEKKGGVNRFKHRLSTGELRDVEVYSGYILLGGVVRLYSIIHDVTEEVKAYNELTEAKVNAEKASQLKSEFLAIMSHELKTPLNAMIGFADLIKVDSVSADIKKYASFIYKSGLSLNRLIADIFDLALLHSKQQRLDCKYFYFEELWEDLRVLVDGAFRDSKLEQIFERDNIPNNLQLYSDKEKITQIIINLVNNAFKYTEKGYVKLSVSVQNSNLMFCIKDSGIGIKPENQNRIFEYFVQGERASRRKIGGAGIGLAVSKGFADLLGAKLWLDSEPGKGTQFFLEIPGINAKELARN